MHVTCAGEDCSIDLSTSKNKSIACDYCNEWFCVDCSKVPKKVFDAIHATNKNKDDLSMVLFLCSKCKMTATALTRINRLATDIKDVKENIEKLIEDMNSNSAEIKLHIDNKITENSNEVIAEYKTQKETFAEIIKRNSNSSVEKINVRVKQALDESSLAVKEQETRDRSIMFYNLKESTSENTKDRISDDLKYVNDFIAEGLHISAMDIESCIRIGKYDANGNRPLKVQFANRSDQIKILKNLGNLKAADDKYKKCFVTMDRNMKQREEIRKLVREAKDKSEASTDKFYLVRGTPFNPFIVEVEKRG